MKSRKLNLDELKVESFITSFDARHDGTVKGGIEAKPHDTHILVCDIYATFMRPDTGGCQHTDNGNMCTVRETKTLPPIQTQPL